MLETRPFQVCLICSFCSSDRGFASDFFQTPPHDGRPCLWLTVPAVKPVADFLRQVITRAEHTRKGRPHGGLPCGLPVSLQLHSARVWFLQNFGLQYYLPLGSCFILYHRMIIGLKSIVLPLAPRESKRKKVLSQFRHFGRQFQDVHHTPLQTSRTSTHSAEMT